MKKVEIDEFTFINDDNMNVMKQYPDKYFDLAIVDKINMFLLLLCQSIFCIFVSN